MPNTALCRQQGTNLCYNRNSHIAIHAGKGLTGLIQLMFILKADLNKDTVFGIYAEFNPIKMITNILE